RKWYELSNKGNPNWFEKPKIITPDISDTNNFVYDDKGYYCVHTCYVIVLKAIYEDLYLYILALLNSKLLQFIFKNIAVNLGVKGYRYITQSLEQLPIKLPSANNKKQLQSKDQIIALVNKIIQKVKLEQKIENFPEDYIKPYRMQGEEFDILLHRVKHSYKELKPKIQTTMNDKYRVSLGSGDAIYSNVIDSMQKAEYVKLCLEDKDFL
ncbi:MAG: TaqI-like C-terminal specificity domain-containing protein, partial [Methanosarcinales archaeon]